ncbi:MAG: tetratricopeptide repeat protein [Anaerolineales bacterium]|nr:tetratricopeptide repeat protein [Anaerolineales bacterium]
MTSTYSFGEWLKQRRKQLKLTQREVATAVYCSTAMIKKIESDQRHPSIELAQALATTLQIPPEQHTIFVETARGERPLDHLTALPAYLSNRSLHTPSPLHSLTPALPTPTTPFIGRKNELAQIVERLVNGRLLTLLGPGGMGKTRLALEAARQMQATFADGAIFVNLTAVTDPSHIPQAIAQALQTPLSGSAAPVAQLQRLLRRRHILLLLDNFEQLTEGSTMLSDLLAAAPRLTLLVTSRERLNLAEEWLFPVPALDEAVTLFEQTAVRVKPDFDVTGEETAVSHICQLVGGHPLAVELAASWTRFMPCAQIAAQIEQDLDFLAGGARNTPERHHSLRALFDHSWQLLTPAEQNALAKLSVFRGGFAPEQAAAVAKAGWPILLGLVDKSLVETRGDNRFDLHDLIRQYAAAKLAESDQAKTAHRAHFAAFAALAKQLSDWFTSPKAAASFLRSDQEHENYRSALHWGLAQEPIEAVLEMMHNLFVFWLRGGYWHEGEQWMKTAVAKAPLEDSIYLCLTLGQQGVFTALQGRFAEANPKTQRAYRMARRLEEPWPLVITLQIQGQARRDKEGAMAAFAEAIAICRERLDEPQFSAFYGSLLGLQGDRLLGFGMLAEAKASFEASVSHLQAIGDTFWIAYPMGNLGRMALHDGDLEKAYQLISESVAITRSSGNRGSIADWLFRLGQVHLYRGELAEAELILQETLRLYEETDNAFGPPGVLSNLALMAVERGDMGTAVTLIQDCFNRYNELNASAKKVDFRSDFFEFGDTLDSLLHAGLVAHAHGHWQAALLFFSFFEKNLRGYAAIRPLQNKVEAAKSEIQAHVGAAAYETAVAESQQLTLDELLKLSL